MQDMSRAASSKSGICLDHIDVGKDFLLHMGTFDLSFCAFPLSPFTLDLLLSILESPLILGPFTVSPFRTPRLLHPRRLRTHPLALDYDLVNFSLFWALRLAARVYL